MDNLFVSEHGERISLGKMQFRVSHHHPECSSKETQHKKTEIEQQLFQIFRKYE